MTMTRRKSEDRNPRNVDYARPDAIGNAEHMTLSSGSRSGSTRIQIFIVRILRTSVVALGFTVPLFDDVLGRLETAHRVLIVSSLWATWAIMLLSVLVPATSSLTSLRLVAPAHLGICVVTTALAGIDVPSALALAVSAVASIASSSAETGAHFVQASAYGDERRFPLRCPRPTVAVLIVAWVLWFAAAASGAGLLAGGQWSGSIPAAVALIGFAFLPRRFHVPARRWLVEVPAGIVIHDQVELTETAMFARRNVLGVEAWSSQEMADTAERDAPLDVSGCPHTPGVVIRLSDPETIIIAPTSDHPGGRALHVRSVKVCPTRVNRTLEIVTRSQ